MRFRAGSAAAAAAVIVGAIVIAISLADGDEAAQVTGTDDPGVAHIHGLGIDPSDDALLAATHFGVFRIPERGEPTRIADRFQDTMGFTVVGPDHFLASGHPDMQDEALRPPAGKPPLLGLIESTDGAKSWVPLSLLGEADFHALVAAHDRIYGYDSTNQRLMVSTDGRNWETRSQGKLLISLAVDPNDPELIVATGEPGGVYLSRDGGRTFERTPGAPPMLWLSWDDETGLWGAADDGTVLQSTDGGASWRAAGKVDEAPAALLVHRGQLYVGLADGSIVRSADNAHSWDRVFPRR